MREVTGAAAAGTLLSMAPRQGFAAPRGRKAVVVTFGGGARDEETFMPDGQENIPHLLNGLMPRATFFSQMVNRGILGHYVATASLATGAYETFNNFAAVPPTGLRFSKLPQGFEAARGRRLGSGAEQRFQPDRRERQPFLRARLGRWRDFAEAAAGGGPLVERRPGLRAFAAGQHETPLYAPELGGNQVELHQMAEVMRLSVADFAAHARVLASPDELSVYIARHLMRQLAPSLLWITLHDIDIAHSGTYSLYLEAIRRTDRLCGEIWNNIQSEPEYANKTNLFILPDFGRDSDDDAGGNGFQHHRTGDPLSRTTWMMAMGPGVRRT